MEGWAAFGLSDLLIVKQFKQTIQTRLLDDKSASSNGTARRLIKKKVTLELLLPGVVFNAHWIQLFPYMMRLPEQGRPISFERGEAVFLHCYR